MSGENLHALTFMWPTASAIVRWVLTCTQLLLPAAAEAMVRIRLLGQTACTVYANGICGPDDRRDVMRLMDLLHADRQVRLTLASISQIRS